MRAWYTIKSLCVEGEDTRNGDSGELIKKGWIEILPRFKSNIL